MVLSFIVASRDKRGLGKNRGVMWNIRYNTNENEGVVSFKTFNRSILLKHKDVLLLSFKKHSKGLFDKQWTGEWKREPGKLVNVNLNTTWNI